MLGKLDINVQRNETGPLSITVYKSQLKMGYRLKCKIGNYETTRREQCIGMGKDFLDKTPETQEAKTKGKQMGFY